MAEEKDKVKAKRTFPLIVSEMTFTQPPNCSVPPKDSRGHKIDEEMKVSFHDGGGGFFYVINTHNFAIGTDSDILSKVDEICNLICKNNDIIDAENQVEYGLSMDREEQRARQAEEQRDHPLEVPF